MARPAILNPPCKTSYSLSHNLGNQGAVRSVESERKIQQGWPSTSHKRKVDNDGNNYHRNFHNSEKIHRGNAFTHVADDNDVENKTEDDNLTFEGPPLNPRDLVEQRVETLNPFMPAVFIFRWVQGPLLKPRDLVEQRVDTLNPFMPAVFNFPKVKDSAQAQTLEHTSQNLATELGLTEADRQPPGVLNTKIFLSEETVPLLCVVFGTDKSQADKNRTAADARDYARSLARELTHKMRDFTDESFNFLCTEVEGAEATNIEMTQMSARLLKENGHLYPYERMTMYQRKFQNLQKSLHFVMSATSVPFYTRNGMPARSKQDDTDNVPIYQLTREQLEFMQDLLKKDKPCFVTGKPGSGKTVMAVEIARRLNQDGGALLICHDLALKDKLADSSNCKDIRTCPDGWKQSKCKHIVAVKVREKDLHKYKGVEPLISGGKLLVFSE